MGKIQIIKLEGFTLPPYQIMVMNVLLQGLDIFDKLASTTSTQLIKILSNMVSGHCVTLVPNVGVTSLFI